MSFLLKFTPFRQMSKVYTSLLSLSVSAQEISQTLRNSSRQLQSPKDDVVEKISGEHSSSKLVDIYQRYGMKLLLDRTSLVDRVVIESGEWEPLQTNYLLALAEKFRGKEKNVFLDIGSCWGLYSLPFWQSKLVDEIYAFEADAHNFSQFQSNLFLNSATHDITAFNKAVNATNGYLHVWDSTTHPDGNRGGVGIVGEDFAFATHKVDAVMIDSFMNLSDSNVVIKIDIEGHESSALQGLENTIKNNRILMQIEIYEPQMNLTVPLLEKFGLRRIHQIERDFYYTNITF